ncbi:MAG TPA: hypothetical protein VNJ04_08170 [Gemmatimonadaceae bacterium]|nr:hypothetical protein [Gemmatimonadaceae bacterium]
MRRRLSMRTAPRPGRAIPDGFVRQLGDAHWELRIERELKSPNKTLWAHWRLKQAERQAWEAAVLLAIARYGGMAVVAGAQLVRLAGVSLFVAAGARERRRVVLTRLVPSVRNFIRDDDNLSFSGKPVFDALKRIGLLYEDKREFLDAPRPSQVVSPDGRYLTVIEIQRLGMVPATRTRKPITSPAAAEGLLS